MVSLEFQVNTFLYSFTLASVDKVYKFFDTHTVRFIIDIDDSCMKTCKNHLYCTACGQRESVYGIEVVSCLICDDAHCQYCMVDHVELYHPMDSSNDYLQELAAYDDQYREVQITVMHCDRDCISSID